MWWTFSAGIPGACPGEKMFKSFLVCGCFRAIINQTFSNLGSKTRKLARPQLYLITVTMPQLKSNIYKGLQGKSRSQKSAVGDSVSVPCLITSNFRGIRGNTVRDFEETIALLKLTLLSVSCLFLMSSRKYTWALYKDIVKLRAFIGRVEL